MTIAEPFRLSGQNLIYCFSQTVTLTMGQLSISNIQKTRISNLKFFAEDRDEL